jgi:hypothetical protein
VRERPETKTSMAAGKKKVKVVRPFGGIFAADFSPGSLVRSRRHARHRFQQVPYRSARLAVDSETGSVGEGFRL